jgi:hypothetical protein
MTHAHEERSQAIRAAAEATVSAFERSQGVTLLPAGREHIVRRVAEAMEAAAVREVRARRSSWRRPRPRRPGPIAA